MNRPAFLSGCSGALALGATRVSASPQITLLDAHASQLRSAFNARVADVRLVLIVSPT